jgi:SAM-dependent methyltransferase
MGLAMPFRIAMIPAMVVVETAPRPTSRIPSFPLAGLIDIACVTAENYIIRLMFRWSTMFRPFPNLRKTAVAMIDPRPGDAVLFVGAGDPALAGECGAVAGLNGRTVVVDANASMASRVEAAAVNAGALVEFTAAPPPTLPFATGTFAVVVVPDLASWPNDERQPRFTEAFRVASRARASWCSWRRSAASCGRVLQHKDRRAIQVLHLFTRVGAVAARELANTDGVAYYEGGNPDSRGLGLRAYGLGLGLRAYASYLKHVRCLPPSTLIVSPVIQAEAGDRRNAMRSAISSA